MGELLEPNQFRLCNPKMPLIKVIYQIKINHLLIFIIITNNLKTITH